MADVSAGRSRLSPRRSWKPGCFSAARRNSAWPVEKLSQPTTRLRRLNRTSTRLLPMNPAAPVTNMFSKRSFPMTKPTPDSVFGVQPRVISIGLWTAQAATRAQSTRLGQAPNAFGAIPTGPSLGDRLPLGIARVGGNHLVVNPAVGFLQAVAEAHAGFPAK